jgi:hypothetical protein
MAANVPKGRSGATRGAPSCGGAGGLRAGFHAAEQVVGSGAMVLPALAARLDRAAGLVLLSGGGRPGEQRCDSNGCDCNGEMTHVCLSLGVS